MALVRMRESICMPATYYQDITDKAPESMKESLSKINAGQKLTESMNVDSIVQVLKESNVEDTLVTKIVNKLKETGVNVSDHKIYRVPVARFDNINGNRRRYPRKLWENVMNNQESSWKGLCGLADHPEGDTNPGSIKDSSVVWLGMEIDDLNKLVYGICSFVGTLGHMFQEIIDVGGRVGFSSSGFGELLMDGETVNPDTYQIERLADVVLNPSQDVYGEIADEQKGLGNIEYSGKKIPESVMTESTNTAPKSAVIRRKAGLAQQSTEQVNNPTTENNGENIMAESAYSKAQEKALRNHITSFLNENTSISDPIQRMADLNEILTIIKEGKLTDLEDGVVAKLEEQAAILNKDIADAQKMKEALGNSDLSQITNEAIELAETTQVLGEQVADYKTLCEGLVERNNELSNQIKGLKFRLELKEKKAENITLSKHEKAVSDKVAFDALTEELKDMRRENKVLTESVSRYKAGNEKLERLNSALSKKLDEANTILQNNAKLKESKAEETNIKMQEFEAVKSENEMLRGMIERVQKRNADLKQALDEAQAKLNETENKLTEATVPNIHVQPAFKERVSQYFNFRENEGLGIEAFWTDLVTKYGESIEQYESKIRDAKTLREAQAAFYKVLPVLDKNLSAVREATFDNTLDMNGRVKMLEKAGMNIDRGQDVELVNARARKLRNQFGLK